MPYRLKNIRVLLIDGNKPVRDLIRALLVDLGFNLIDVADNEKQGWEMLNANIPDAVIVDWRFDDDNTLEFVRRIRQSRTSPAPDVPIIMMTGYTNKELLFRARDAGVNEFLMKPFTVETLTRQFVQLIERPRDFVIAQSFVGPDRRRRDATVDDASKKRKVDKNTTQKDKA